MLLLMLWHRGRLSRPIEDMVLQMQLLQKVHQGLEQEHALRRSMLVKRAKLTLDSLLTSPRLMDQGTQVRLHLHHLQSPCQSVVSQLIEIRHTGIPVSLRL